MANRSIHLIARRILFSVFDSRTKFYHTLAFRKSRRNLIRFFPPLRSRSPFSYARRGSVRAARNRAFICSQTQKTKLWSTSVKPTQTRVQSAGGFGKCAWKFCFGHREEESKRCSSHENRTALIKAKASRGILACMQRRQIKAACLLCCC
jgi:hypothetical protein